MTRRLIVFLAVGVVCVPAAAAAQVTTVAAQVCGPYAVTTKEREPDGLTRDYAAGNWTALQKRGRDIIDAVNQRSKPGEGVEKPEGNDHQNPACVDLHGLLDYRKNYIAITWVGFDPVKEKPQVMRAVVHERPPRPFIVDLPGIGGTADDPMLVELFVSRGIDASLAAMYTSTREENPVAAQVPDFAKAVAGPLFATVGAIAGTAAQRSFSEDLRRNREKGVTPFAVTVYRVGLPMRRASIRLQANARDMVDSVHFQHVLDNLATAVMFKEAARSECARRYAADLPRGLASVRDSTACAGDASNPRACAAAFDTFFRSAYKDYLPACKDSKDDVEALQKVDQAFRDEVRASATATTDLDMTFHNRPLTRFSFGAGAAVIAKAWPPLESRIRVVVDDSGNLQSDPLPRVMTLAYVNWSPRGYDAEADPMQGAERWRWFFGAALTPDFGPVGGGTFTVVRGFGVTAGAGILFGKGAYESDLGQPPTSKTDQYRLAAVPVLFVGASYVFK